MSRENFEKKEERVRQWSGVGGWGGRGCPIWPFFPLSFFLESG